ncbi:OmpA family protein [Arcobacter ellisii]|jgi:OOP family OmpA-OmpF porin|uniref:Flagellar motor protein MotB n=1 Tax=Arcobacter ellisii TaxID=913109 RepID=A0A347U644_9BACT|nr:OmpA family protein [Arcobacter ellisii]AXX94322.1 outer membrane fibronectin-binding protein [Arcobacter ellisii]RXI31025.1 flagellar motor protein MotB [Arcobacter ellisii]
MKRVLLSTIACASLALAANSDYKYEITPLIGGVHTEGNLDLDRNYANAGLSLGFNQFDSFIDQVELGFLRSIEDVGYTGTNNDTGVTRIFTNLIKEYPLTADASLYTLVGAGVEVFDDEAKGNEDGLFGNYGAGIKYKVAEELSLKFDVRHVIEADHGDNNLLYTLGFAVPFGEVAKAAPVVEKPAPVETPAPVAAPKDTDGDGVIDNLDECPDTMKGAKVDTVGCMTLINLNINFDTDKSVIKDSYNSRIAEFAKMMKANPKLKASIEAHTDSVGSNAYNQKLSERRAASTVKALTDLGVDSTKIKAVGFGETRPVASNETVEGRAENRRVEAVMVK